MPVSPRYTELLRLMEEVHRTKNAGYAGDDQQDPWANFRLATLFGVPPSTGALIRLSDKIARLASLTRQPSNEQVGESVLDSAIDAAAYALIFACLYEEEHAPSGDSDA